MSHRREASPPWVGLAAPEGGSGGSCSRGQRHPRSRRGGLHSEGAARLAFRLLALLRESQPLIG